MKIVPNDRMKKAMIKRYWRSTRRLLTKSLQPILEKAESVDPQSLKDMVPYLIQEEEMQRHIDQLWGKVGGRFGWDTERKIKPAKKFENVHLELKADKEKLIGWEERMTYYSAQRSLAKAKKIMTTLEESINTVIDSVLEESLNEGLGVPETRKLMVHDLKGEVMTQMKNWQAERIARTEVNSASNTASYEAAKESPEGVKKYWDTSGLSNIRETHLQYEAMGAVELSYEYAPGLSHPGDPRCQIAEEVINCRCVENWEIDNQRT